MTKVSLRKLKEGSKRKVGRSETWDMGGMCWKRLERDSSLFRPYYPVHRLTRPFPIFPFRTIDLDVTSYTFGGRLSY